MHIRWAGIATPVLAVALFACGGASSDAPSRHQPQDPSQAPRSAVLIAAGDIAQCGSPNDEATADLLDSLPGTVAVLGDAVYERGAPAEFTDCYEPSWGRHKARTRPALGNHDYNTRRAAGYFDYFGAAAGDRRKGYYSYDLGEWHIVVLNTKCAVVSCATGSAQERWLRADLAAHPEACTLAYFHRPRFSSGAHHGDAPDVQPLWQALYDAGADVVLSAHEHLYERFGPQTPAGIADSARGIRQFTVGTGGRILYRLGPAKPNSEVRNNTTFGVLALTLDRGSYHWRFVPVKGSSFTDSGAGSCH